MRLEPDDASYSLSLGEYPPGVVNMVMDLGMGNKIRIGFKYDSICRKGLDKSLRQKDDEKRSNI